MRLPDDDPGLHEVRAIAHRGVCVDAQAWKVATARAQAALEAAANSDDSKHADAARDRLRALQGYRYPIWGQAAANDGGRVFATWTLQGPGRIGIVDPPLQCVTKGHGLRACFRPAPGHAFIVTDWNAAHLWIAAGLTGDDALLRDLHSGAAYEATGKLFETGRGTRTTGKRLALAMINGAAPLKLSEIAGVPPRQAENGREDFRERYPVLREGMERLATEFAWVTQTPMERRVRVPKRGERTPDGRTDTRGRYGARALAWHWQAIEADALRYALQIAPPWLRAVLLVHDEVVWEVPESRQARAQEAAEEIMAEAMMVCAQLPSRIPAPSLVSAEMRDAWGTP